MDALIENSKAAILTYADFLELMEKLPKTIASLKNMSDLDTITRKLFLNFTVKEKSVANATLNSPFDVLETKNVSRCAR